MNTSLNFSTVVTGLLEENCYIVDLVGLDAGDCCIIDPGDEAERIIGAVKAQGLKPVQVVLTHGHGDHTGALDSLFNEWPQLHLAMHEGDLYMLRRSRKALPLPDRLLKDKDTLGPLTVLYTPGHSQGSICLYAPQSGVLFSGDTLFKDGVGRTDLKGGNQASLLKSLERLFNLPPETKVYPGHGPESSIAYESKNFWLEL
jgi:glyoxylase-like metal-dependent hydrolase (beta-lactamase superfamily II)